MNRLVFISSSIVKLMFLPVFLVQSCIHCSQVVMSSVKAELSISFSRVKGSISFNATETNIVNDK